MSKITTDKLAQMTQRQFERVDERFKEVRSDLQELKGDVRGLKTGQERILEVLLGIPSKKAFEKFTTRTEVRLTALEKKVGI